jgi:hypothetical protein
VYLAAVVGLSGCGGGAEAPRSGETVTPVLSKQLKLTAGKPAELQVRLQAKSGEGAGRPLDFTGIPADSNPSATITFFAGDQALEPVEVPLSHRC